MHRGVRLWLALGVRRALSAGPRPPLVQIRVCPWRPCAECAFADFASLEGSKAPPCPARASGAERSSPASPVGRPSGLTEPMALLPPASAQRNRTTPRQPSRNARPPKTRARCAGVPVAPACAHKLTNELLHKRPVGLMDKTSAFGAGDSRFESWAGRATCIGIAISRRGVRAPRIILGKLRTRVRHPS